MFAPGSHSKIKITGSTLSSSGFLGGTSIVSEGKAEVSGTTFLVDTTPEIHGNVECKASGNTPSTAVCQ